ncbi:MULTISPECIES: Ig-like domain-containing protein [Cupriavidus]|nr:MULTISPECIES: Ig-like domain-containing protein [Cupriavidus]
MSYQLTLSPAAAQVAVGKAGRLVATVVDSNGATVNDPVVTFTSSDPTVASVSADLSSPGTAIVTGVKSGGTMVTATFSPAGGPSYSQIANITVVTGDAPTYSLMFPSQSVNLQYGKQGSITAAIIDSEGRDVTAQATGWTWVASNSGMVSVSAASQTATLLASNPAQTVSVSYITAKAVAPDGSKLVGHIAAVAIPDYTYRIQLSSATAKISTDLTPTIIASVIRSDGEDVTLKFGYWRWTLPAVPVNPPPPADAPMYAGVVTSAIGNVATLSSGLLTGAKGSYATFPLVVSALGNDVGLTVPDATIQVSLYPTWAVDLGIGPITTVGTVSSTSYALTFYHNSVDENAAAPLPCSSLRWSSGLDVIRITPNPADISKGTISYDSAQDGYGLNGDWLSYLCKLPSGREISASTKLTFP